MKRIKLTLLLLCAVMLCACRARQAENPTDQPPEQKQQEETLVIKTSEPVYACENQTVSRQFTDEESGILYATYSYSVPMMSIANAENLTEDALVIAQRNVEVFNARMQEILDESVTYGEEMGAEVDIGDSDRWMIVDEKKMTVTQTGQILTVWADCYFYGGGAHPFVYMVSYTFDLSLGNFIDPAQIGDDPESFRVKTAALLVAKAEELGEEYTADFWPDYADIISRWNDTAVKFDADRMIVYFSAYDLGPYAMGPVELILTYEEIADAIGEGGLKHLGVIG